MKIQYLAKIGHLEFQDAGDAGVIAAAHNGMPAKDPESYSGLPRAVAIATRTPEIVATRATTAYKKMTFSDIDCIVRVDGVECTPDNDVIAEAIELQAFFDAIYAYDNGYYADQWVLKQAGAPEAEQEPETPQQIKRRKKALAKEKAAAAIKSIGADYSEEEQKTWWIQYMEALNYSANSEFSTPFLDGVIEENPTRTKQELVGSILAKAAPWAAQAGRAVGKRQKEMDVIDSL
jgi:hypothetical protein